MFWNDLVLDIKLHDVKILLTLDVFPTTVYSMIAPEFEHKAVSKIPIEEVYEGIKTNKALSCISDILYMIRGCYIEKNSEGVGEGFRIWGWP